MQLTATTAGGKREDVLEVESMRRELLEELPKLQLLHEALRSANLADVVLMCVGENLFASPMTSSRWWLSLCVLVGKAMDNVRQCRGRGKQQPAGAF